MPKFEHRTAGCWFLKYQGKLVCPLLRRKQSDFDCHAEQRDEDNEAGLFLNFAASLGFLLFRIKINPSFSSRAVLLHLQKNLVKFFSTKKALFIPKKTKKRTGFSGFLPPWYLKSCSSLSYLLPKIFWFRIVFTQHSTRSHT